MTYTHSDDDDHSPYHVGFHDALDGHAQCPSDYYDVDGEWQYIEGYKHGLRLLNDKQKAAPCMR